MAMYEINIIGTIGGQKGEITYQRWVSGTGQALEEGLACAKNSEAVDPIVSISEIEDQLNFISEIHFPNGKISRRKISAYSKYDARRKTVLYCQKTGKDQDKIVITEDDE